MTGVRQDAASRRSAAIGMGLLALALLAVAAVGESLQESLQWSRADIARGEWWRLLTGHLVHLDLDHAALNVAALVLLWWLFGDVLPFRDLALIVIAAVVAIDAMLWWLVDIDQYRGLSGTLHAYAAAAVVRRIIERHDPLAWIIGVSGLAKILWENLAGAMPFLAPTIVVVTDVHLAGVLVGMLAGVLLRRGA